MNHIPQPETTYHVPIRLSRLNSFAGASAAAVTCGSDTVSLASAAATATAIAEAHAIAASYIYADCAADEGSYACTNADTLVTDAAYAVAEAFANSWAGALTCDGCYVNVDRAAEAIGSILVEAASSA